MWMTPDGMGWWMLFGGILWVVLWPAVIYLIVYLVRGLGEKSLRGEGDAVEIARRRYASGEIGKDEFETILEHLRGRPSKAA